jgi:replicative DNA helicase
LTDEFEAYRIPPQALDAEMALLGAVLVDSGTLVEVAPIVRHSAFYAHVHGTIWEAIIRLHAKDQPVDLIAVAEDLRSREELEKVGGISYLRSLMDTIQTTSSARYYARLVAEKAIRREIIAAGGKIIDAGFEESEPLQGTIGTINGLLSDILANGAPESGRTAAEAVGRYEDVMNSDRGAAILSPWSQINKLTGGFTGDEFNVVAADSKLGKSFFLNLLAVYVSIRFGDVAIFATEMGEFKTISRLIALFSGVSARRQREGRIALRHDRTLAKPLDEWEIERIEEAKANVRVLPIHLFEQSLSADEIVAHCRRLNQRRKLSAVLVDTLGAMRIPRLKGQSKTDAIEESVKTLKFGAKEIDAPFFAAHHLNRGDRKHGRPTADNLRDGGNLDGWASSVIFLVKTDQGGYEFYVERTRDGNSGIVDAKFDGSLAMWWEAAETDPWTPSGFVKPNQDDLFDEGREIL